jgi:hypothetical protein
MGQSKPLFAPKLRRNSMIRCNLNGSLATTSSSRYARKGRPIFPIATIVRPTIPSVAALWRLTKITFSGSTLGYRTSSNLALIQKQDCKMAAHLPGCLPTPALRGPRLETRESRLTNQSIRSRVRGKPAKFIHAPEQTPMMFNAVQHLSSLESLGRILSLIAKLILPASAKFGMIVRRRALPTCASLWPDWRIMLILM